MGVADGGLLDNTITDVEIGDGAPRRDRGLLDASARIDIDAEPDADRGPLDGANDPDAATPTDRGLDTELTPDAARDGGTTPDATPIDAQLMFDATSRDAQPTPDAAPFMDGALPIDASRPMDAVPSMDAVASMDVVVPPVDAVRPMDAAVDAQPELDTGQPMPDVGIDAGSGDGFGLPLFGPDFPKGFFFRLEPYSGRDLDEWTAEMTRLDGWVAKPLREELFGLHDMAASRLNTIAELPGQAALAHFNSRAMDPRIAPAHWPANRFLHYEGCDATVAIEANVTTICLPLQCVGRYSTSTGRLAANMPDDLTIAMHPAGGAVDWTTTEQVKLSRIGQGVCPHGGQNIEHLLLEIRRAQFGTNARRFARAYVAAHVTGGPWGDLEQGNRLLWFYNYADGAGPALAEYVANAFEPDGPLSALDGIVLDIAPFTLDSSGGRRADGDGDGVGDDGFSGAGINTYGQGVHAFYRDLREALPDKILVADGGLADSQRSVAYLNGMEAEGIGGWNDPLFTKWAAGVNRLVYWLRHAHEPRFSFIAHKGNPVANEVRVVLGAATALGAAFTSTIWTRDVFDTCPREQYAVISRGVFDEFLGGTLDQRRWLGAPVGELRRPGLSAPDQLDGGGVDVNNDFLARLDGIGSRLRRAVNAPTLVVEPTEAADGSVSFRLRNVPVVAGTDYILQFRVRGDALEGFPADVPRNIAVTSVNGTLPVRDGVPLQAETLHGLFGADFTRQVFYFRNTRADVIDFEIRFEGEGDVRLRDIMVHHETDTMIREFEHGIIAVNPSAHRGIRVDLGPGRYRRLQSTPCQAIDVHDGAAVDGVVQIPPMDALFLLRD